MVFCRFLGIRMKFGFDRAHVAQLVEHILGKDEVVGSIPMVGSRRKKTEEFAAV